jgi:hypothetical protein
MKRSWLFFISIAFFTTAVAQSNKESVLNKQVERLKAAMVNADSSELVSITHPLLSYGHSSGRIEDRASFIQSLVSGKSDFLNMQLSEQSIAISGKTAIVRHALEADINDSGNPGKVKLKVNVGEWLM